MIKKLLYYLKIVQLVRWGQYKTSSSILFNKNNRCLFVHGLKHVLFNDLITFIPNFWVRRIYLINVLKIRIGAESFVHKGARFEGNIIIGNNSVIGRNSVLLGDITIKDNVSITAESYMFTWTHNVDCPEFSCYGKPIIINDYVWIGARAVILPGVEIGNGAVVGANSTVTKNISCYDVCVGSPARVIRKRKANQVYNLIYFPFFE